MRRERNGYKFIIISLVVVSVLVALLIGTIISRNVRNSREKEFAGQMSKLSEELSETDTASTQIGKSVEEAKSEEIEEDVELEEPKLNIEENKVEQTKANISSVDNNISFILSVSIYVKSFILIGLSKFLLYKPSCNIYAFPLSIITFFIVLSNEDFLSLEDILEILL